MTDARETAERLAVEKYPDVPDGFVTQINEGPRRVYVAGFLAGRTVSAKQIEAAAKALHSKGEGDRAADWDEDDIETDPRSYAYEYDWREHWRDKARATFRAAGFRIEGEE